MKTSLSIIVTVVLFTAITNTFAQVVQPVDKHNLANGGYDFVAYFSSNAAVKGKKEFTHVINGVKYQFASAENKNMFKNDPSRYLPVCDGYCAWGVAEKGKKVPVNPETFKVINGKLYLFFNGDFNGSPFNTLPEWNKNEQNLLTQLPANWERIKN
jgi:YHS domain-containing protein